MRPVSKKGGGLEDWARITSRSKRKTQRLGGQNLLSTARGEGFYRGAAEEKAYAADLQLARGHFKSAISWVGGRIEKKDGNYEDSVREGSARK